MDKIIDKYLNERSKPTWKKEKGVFKTGKCDECDKNKLVTWTRDPYEQDVKHKSVFKHLCQDCLDDLTDQV